MICVGLGLALVSSGRSSGSLSNRLEQVLRLLNLRHQCWYILNLILVGCSQLHLYPHLFISIWLTFLSNRLERVHRRVLFSIPLERGRLLPVDEDVRDHTLLSNHLEREHHFLSNRLERVHRRVLFSIPLERGRLLPVDEDVRDHTLPSNHLEREHHCFLQVVHQVSVTQSSFQS